MRKPVLRIIQISDTHLYANPQRALLGVNTKESFQAVIDLLQKEKGKIDFILHTGDISQDYSQESYLQLVEMIKDFNVPVYCIPGNHDDPEMMAQVYPRDNVTIQKNIIVKNWQFILLNSHKPGAVEGYLEPSELKFMQECLLAYPDHQSIVAFHHHPTPMGMKWLDRLWLTNADELWDAVAKHKNVHTILFGHVHQAFEKKVNNIPCYAPPSTCIQFNNKQDHFGLENIPPGYRLLELYDDGKLQTAIVRTKQYVGVYEEKAKGY